MATIRNTTDTQNDLIAYIYENTVEAISGQDLQDRLCDMAVSYINRITDKQFLNLQEFSASRGYDVGECTVRTSIIYQCITAHTGTWNAANFAVIVSAGAYLPLAGGTMSGDILFTASKGIDTTVTGGTDTLNIGVTNADAVVVGRSTKTVSILGITTFAYDITVQTMTIGQGAGSDVFNTVVGDASFSVNTTGSYGTAMGYNALKANTTGNNSTAFGSLALQLNANGHDNAAFGSGALGSNVSSSLNAAFGNNSLPFSTGSQNTGLGSNAGDTNTTGSFNTYVGSDTGNGITTGGYNTLLGAQITCGNLTGNILIADGHGNVRLQFDSSGNATFSGTVTGAISGSTGNISQWTNDSGYLTTIAGIAAGGELSGTYVNPTLVNSAVIGKVLTGLSVSGSTITSTDTILQAFGKVQNQINSLVGGVNYQGVWNASTNSPALADGAGTKGYYYVVSVAGSTSLDGVTDWKLGDWVIFNGTTWQKVDNTDAVVTVNGYVGAVVLTTADVAESGNLYFTNARSISSTLTGYVSGAGVISSTDTVLGAIQKLNGNIGALVTGVSSVNSLTGVVALTGTANRVTVSAANVFDISVSYVGQASITTLGTITTGVWNGTAIANANLANADVANLSGTNTGDQTITLTGDITGSGTGSFTTTLATVNGNVGSFGSSTSIPSFTVNAKGLITAASGNAVIAPAGTLTGTTLNATVVDSSLTSVGTITAGVWTGTTIAIANGGTGQTTANAGFNALSPMTTGGDIIYGGASGVATRLANGSAGQVLTSSGTTLAPTWTTISSGGITTLAAIGAAPNANGATITGATLNLQPADASFGGIITTGTQTFAGSKTFPTQFNITQTATATGALKGFVYTGAVNTNQTLSTEIPSITFTTAGRQWATGALTTQREILIDQPTYSFVGASTITDAATVAIVGAPIKSTNATITNTHGLLIQAGAVSTATNSYGITVNAQTGATNNWSGQFLGQDLQVNSVRLGRGKANISTNTVCGFSGLNAITTGDLNTAMGYNSSLTMTTGAGNASFGYQALKTSNGTLNTAIGYRAMEAGSSGDRNTMIGGLVNYLGVNTGSDNTAVGHNAMQKNTSGGTNTAIGQAALYDNTQGALNIALGNAAGFKNTTGSNNIYIGHEISTGNGNLTGSGNVIIGSQLTGALTSSSTNNIVIGDGAGNVRMQFASTGALTLANSSITLATAGNGILIKEGTNATHGLATLVGGTLVVSTTKCTANSRIYLTGQGGTITNLGSYSITARTAGTSFTITSSNVLDTNTVAWLIIEPA